ncbi:MAG: ATP-binding cassette domain-containing protein, partial [Sphingobacteriales bacterium]
QKSLVLSDINLNISHGEFCYLIGRTGSGKTSLLRVLYGDLLLREGEGTVAGFDLLKLSKRNIPFLRRKLGIIFQDFQLLTDRSVHDNLLFVLKATGWRNNQLIESRIKEVLKMVSLHEKAYKFPHELSGGEQQKVVIARALLNDPLLILADEPTGNLDPEISEELVGLLHKISAEGTAVIMATHDYRLIEKYPARVLKVENQRVSELG